VEELGPGVTGFAAGDAVASVSVLGSYAEYALVPAAQLVKVPAGLSMEQAAAAMLQGMTAHYLAHSTFPLKAGDTALVHAGAGGVGLLLTQMATRLGARVITTVSTPAKAELSREAGASDVILYTEQDFETEVKRLTGGKGVDVVYDSVGKTTFEGSLNCLRPRGLLALFGASSGPVPPFDLIQLSGKGSLFVTRPRCGTTWPRGPNWSGAQAMCWAGLPSGELKLRTEHMYPLAEAAQAQTDLEERKTTGRFCWNRRPGLCSDRGGHQRGERLPTFRASDGLWAGHRVEDVCTPEAGAQSLALVWEFYAGRRAAGAKAEPNPAHVALAELGGATRRPLLSLHAECGRSARAGRLGGCCTCTASCPRRTARQLRTAAGRGSRKIYRSLDEVGRCACGAAAPAYCLLRRDSAGDGAHSAGDRNRHADGGGRHLGVGLSGGQLCSLGAQHGARTVYVGPEPPLNASAFTHVVEGKAGEAAAGLFQVE
jgi:NADPH2:quinone reductase